MVRVHHGRERLEDGRGDAQLRLLSHDKEELGKVPPTPTTASIIAGVEVHEAIKYLRSSSFRILMTVYTPRFVSGLV